MVLTRPFLRVEPDFKKSEKELTISLVLSWGPMDWRNGGSHKKLDVKSASSMCLIGLGDQR